MWTKPAGLKLDVVLWLGEARISLRIVIATCAPQVGNGIHSARKSLYYREFARTSGAPAT